MVKVKFNIILKSIPVVYLTVKCNLWNRVIIFKVGFSNKKNILYFSDYSPKYFNSNMYGSRCLNLFIY
jgi:hypothetical protein